MSPQPMIDADLPHSEGHGEATPAAFVKAMRQLAGGVSVITTGIGALRTGLTATSVTSLSSEPPSVLVCVNRNSTALLTLRASQVFAVNFLGAGQQTVADSFAGRTGAFGAARYEGAQWSTLATGTPVLEGALANLDCRVEQVIDWHSHAIVIGRVVAVLAEGGDRPLLYWQGAYRGLAAEGGPASRISQVASAVTMATPA